MAPEWSLYDALLLVIEVISVLFCLYACMHYLYSFFVAPTFTALSCKFLIVDASNYIGTQATAKQGCLGLSHDKVVISNVKRQQGNITDEQ